MSLVPTATSVRRALRWVLIPQYVAVGMDPLQEEVSVSLELGKEVLDVGRNNLVASLRPLTIGVMLEASAAAALSERQSHRMLFRDRERRILGVIDLNVARSIDLGLQRLQLFTVAGSDNHCIPWAARTPQDLYERWRTHRHQQHNPFNFQMSHQDLKALFVFYIRPRPVYLVSVRHEDSVNIFPMDLVGPTASSWFSFALRTTSPAVELMKGSGRFIASSVDTTFKTTAYELGRHHRERSIDLSALPFQTRPSLEFGLPAPTSALDIREVSVGYTEEVGSHCLFLTTITRRTLSDQVDRALPLCHIHGSYAEALQAAGRPVARA